MARSKGLGKGLDSMIPKKITKDPKKEIIKKIVIHIKDVEGAI